MDPKHERWVLLILPGGWAAVWFMLHVLRPAAFPWLGIIGGIVIAIPILLARWIEQRKAAGRADKQRDDRPDEHTRR